MDYLRSLSSALTKGAGPLSNYEIGLEVDSYYGQSIWKLFEGKSRNDSSPVSIFMLDQTRASREQIAMAQNAVKKIRSIRHPYLVKFLEVAESQGAIYLVVEHVEPLVNRLAALSQGKGRESSTPSWIAWGLGHVAKALAFLHDQTNSIHGNVHPGSIFLSSSEEWLLGGLEILSSPSEPDPLVLKWGGLPPKSNAYAPPEVSQGGWRVAQEYPIHTVDSYAFCLLAIEAFNGKVPSTLPNFAVGRIPAPLYPLLKRMVHPEVNKRLAVSELVRLGTQPGGFLATNVLYEVETLLEEFRIADQDAKTGILHQVLAQQGHLAPVFEQFKVLPVLIEAFRYQQGYRPEDMEFSTHQLLPVMLKIGQKMDSASWMRLLGDPIIGAFATQDRAMLHTLLTHAQMYSAHLSDSVVSAKFWPLLLKSFHSPLDPIRSAALECVALFFPKFNERILNNELLRELAKLQKDVRPAIRLQTTKILSQLSHRLRASTKADVLIPAFGYSLRDTYDQIRLFGIAAFEDNADNFDGEVSAKSVIPALSPCLVDANGEVRDKALEVLQLYLDKVTTYTESLSSVTTEMPAIAPNHTGVVEPQAQNTQSKTTKKSAFSAFLSATAGSAATALTDWAMAQIEEDENLATQVTLGLQNEITHTPDTTEAQELSPPPAVPLHASRGISLNEKKSKGEQVSHAILNANKEPKPKVVSKINDTKPVMPPPATSKPPLTSTKAPPAVPTSAPLISAAPPSTKAAQDAPTVPTLSKEEKMAQLNKLREERRADYGQVSGRSMEFQDGWVTIREALRCHMMESIHVLDE
ncbi:Nuclear aminoacylation-dependent tRNA export pathway component [Malassezia equina]|uniref:Nuclear aminoacylation-dependent tRNA export pathway component n=1 Tax=Malassezia equina TaxID=1381935 RepID=A0AAF0ECQ3_9BASI|nr:Nuclear aminoacylation-dependent tRNA export pathway component [Malassezia equina]